MLIGLIERVIGRCWSVARGGSGRSHSETVLYH